MSTLLHKAADPHIDPENPWDNDDFQRREYGERLTRLVTNTPGSFVIALKAPWGAGKSTFLKRWEAHLELPATDDKPYVPVVHVDAWKDDYLDDPLTSFVVALKVRLTRDGTEADTDGLIKKLAHGGAKIIAPVARLAAALGTGGGSEVAILSAEAIEKVGESWLSQSETHKDGVEEFTTALSGARDKLCPASNLPGGVRQPLVFVIDELDRCRPDFAIKALERIKHFFGVSGIVFIIATDGDNLPSAVQTLYGSQTNGERYLRKFFDYEFRIPSVSREEIVAWCVRASGLESQILSELDKKSLEDAREHLYSLDRTLNRMPRGLQLLDVVEQFGTMARALSLEPRDALQAMTLIIAVIRSSEPSESLVPPLLALTVCTRYAAPIWFEQILQGRTVLSVCFESKDESHLLRQKNLSQLRNSNSVANSALKKFLRFEEMKAEEVARDQRSESQDFQNDGTERTAAHLVALHAKLSTQSFGHQLRSLLKLIGTVPQ